MSDYLGICIAEIAENIFQEKLKNGEAWQSETLRVESLEGSCFLISLRIDDHTHSMASIMVEEDGSYRPIQGEPSMNFHRALRSLLSHWENKALEEAVQIRRAIIEVSDIPLPIKT